MKSAVIVLSLVVVIEAEAPYHLPRPAVHTPVFRYPLPSAPPPAPPPTFPSPLPIQPRSPSQPQYIQYPPQQNYVQNVGYQYQQPSIVPAPVQFIPQPRFSVQTQPQVAYQPPAQQSLPVSYSQSQPIRYIPPSVSYGIPQLQNTQRPVVSSQSLLRQPQLQPQPAPIYQPISYQQQQGYSYQEVLPHSVQYNPQLPLQAQPLRNSIVTSSLSSYQADSNLYSNGPTQSQSDALDTTVVDHVQNIIKENEQSSARNAGYVSLVSGVSLEGAKPSIEISSFVQNSPLTMNRGLSLSSVSQSSKAVSSSRVNPSSDYGLPNITVNSQRSQSDTNIGFLPQTKSVTSYGAPN